VCQYMNRPIQTVPDDTHEPGINVNGGIRHGRIPSISNSERDSGEVLFSTTFLPNDSLGGGVSGTIDTPNRFTLSRYSVRLWCNHWVLELYGYPQEVD